MNDVSLSLRGKSQQLCNMVYLVNNNTSSFFKYILHQHIQFITKLKLTKCYLKFKCAFKLIKGGARVAASGIFFFIFFLSIYLIRQLWLEVSSENLKHWYLLVY